MGENRCQNLGEHIVCRAPSTNIVTRVEFNLSLSFLAAKIKKKKRERHNQLHISYQKKKNLLKGK